MTTIVALVSMPATNKSIPTGCCDALGSLDEQHNDTQHNETPLHDIKNCITLASWFEVMKLGTTVIYK